jgi:predicted  nucleic acid-binding Zn-ribbon protein
MNSKNRSKFVALSMTVLLMFAMYFVFDMISTNKKLDGDLSKEKVKNEKSFSEKLKLEKDIKDFKAQLASYEGKNKQLDKYLSEMKAKLAEKEKALANTSKATQTAKVYHDESLGIKKMNEDLIAKIASLSNENSRLANELAMANTTIASLNEKSSIQFIEPENVLSTENYRMDPLKKKNDKLTVRASKMQKLAVSFDALSSRSDSNYKLVVKEQTGRTLNGKVAINVVKVSPVYYASTSTEISLKNRKRIELKFEPEQKLKEGIYSIFVYHDNEEVGTAQIRLGK